MPEILFQLKIPKDKIGAAKKELRLLLNSIADEFQDYKQQTLKDPKKAKQLQKSFRSELSPAIKETQRMLRQKLGLKRDLSFILELSMERLEVAYRYWNYALLKE